MRIDAQVCYLQYCQKKRRQSYEMYQIITVSTIIAVSVMRDEIDERPAKRLEMEYRSREGVTPVLQDTAEDSSVCSCTT